MLTYTVETKDWDNIDSYPQLYKGDSLVIAMIHFKEAHLKGEDAVLFIEDKEGNILDTITNYSGVSNIVNTKVLFVPEDKQLINEHKEAKQQKEIYSNMYHEQLNKNDELKKENERLQNENRQLKQNSKKDNNLYWYAYRLRGFSPFCQPKGHIEVKQNIGRHGIIAYDRQLTQSELNEYELIPYTEAV